MNERIKLLADQAGIHFHNGGTLDAGPNGIAKFVLFADMERFAELIVQECVDILNKDDPHISKGPLLKEHFGVEE